MLFPNRHPPSTSRSTQGPNGDQLPGRDASVQPTLRAGVTDATAGAHSPFFINFTRPDGDQELAGLTVSTPPGFSATLKGIPYCSDAALAAAANASYSGLAEQPNPSCSAASQIGAADGRRGSGYPSASTSPARSIWPAPTRARR